MDDQTLKQLTLARDFLIESRNGPILLEEAANAAAMSPFHFHRTFSNAFRTTPHRFHQELRLKEARRLLAFGHQDVTEICFDLGYSSLGSFSALFKSQFGVSPSAYRQEIRSVFLVDGFRERRRIPACFLRSRFVI